MSSRPCTGDPHDEARALVYCEGAYGTARGKTAHGLVRRTRRYRVVGVVDSACAGADAGAVLDGRPREIPIFATLDEALQRTAAMGAAPTHLVIGLCPDGDVLPPEARHDVLVAIHRQLNVDAGLRTFLSDDPRLSNAAVVHKVTIRDVRNPPRRHELHPFTGKVEEVSSFRVAVLGTDAAVGKRTTAWELVDGLCAAGIPTTLIGTGPTAWMQGACHGVVLDSLVNDVVAGELEHAVHSCHVAHAPQVMIIEGQGSLMNPACPGGFAVLAAARPHAVIMQHAPARRDYEGLPGYAIHPLELQIRAVELVSGRPVVGIAINGEGLAPAELLAVCRTIERDTGRPTVDVLHHGPRRLVDLIAEQASLVGGGVRREGSASRQPATR